MDHHNASVSDPESEEENEEGDYTVYECPGFATVSLYDNALVMLVIKKTEFF